MPDNDRWQVSQTTDVILTEIFDTGNFQRHIRSLGFARKGKLRTPEDTHIHTGRLQVRGRSNNSKQRVHTLTTLTVHSSPLPTYLTQTLALTTTQAGNQSHT